MSEAKPHNVEWISNLRFVALVAVIMLHASAVLLAQYGKVPISYWFTADVFNAMVRFAVPVFVMITGALNLGRNYELIDFLKRRLLRIITPFLFWSLVYIGYSWYNEEISFENDTWTNVKLVLHQLKYGSSYHLWYVYMLIGLYLIMPILNKFVCTATQKELLYFLMVWLLVMLFSQPYLSRFKPVVELRYFEGYIGYLVLGYYLTVKEFHQKHLRLLMLLLFVALVAVITIGTYKLTLHNYTTTTLFYEPLGPFIVCLSGSIFLFFRFSNPTLPAFVKQIRDFTGQYAYGVYLCHALFLYLLDLLFDISYKLCSPILSIPLTTLICLVLSVLLTWLLNKIPVIGKYIGG
ncbi:acyltransferase [Mucilaginibacter agri]|uniref:Acyltransferase family protein n=1 Tax=Mucilaginibacter agri TaxID=2695265 RepID=A0A965ZJB7_9SPHI|nr:acyltransferase family protein [Mucilaginibacter agri]NCD71158.1 acyltransferase family protein [Mucilaginibacter agri]